MGKDCLECCDKFAEMCQCLLRLHPPQGLTKDLAGRLLILMEVLAAQAESSLTSNSTNLLEVSAAISTNKTHACIRV